MIWILQMTQNLYTEVIQSFSPHITLPLLCKLLDLETAGNSYPPDKVSA